MLALPSLAGCIDSAQPLFTDALPLIGCHAGLEFYVLRDGAARDKTEARFVWGNGRYVPVGGTARDIHDFTLHAFAGDDLIVQSLRRGHPAEYGIARKLADGAYLLFAVDEADAHEATRGKFLRQERRYRLPRGDARCSAGLCARQRHQAASVGRPCFAAQALT